MSGNAMVENISNIPSLNHLCILKVGKMMGQNASSVSKGLYPLGGFTGTFDFLKRRQVCIT